MNKLLAFLRFVLTLSEVRWWMARAKTQLMDDATERRHFRALILQLAQLAGMSAVVMVLLFNVAMRRADNVPGVELLLPDTSPVVVAREFGVAYNVLAFCNDPIATVGKMAMTDAPAGGTRYIALRGTESVNWADSPPDKNPTAQHYWVAPDGKQNSEPVEVTKDAAACFKRRAK